MKITTVVRLLMFGQLIGTGLIGTGFIGTASAQEAIEITSPGFSPSHLDDQGRLVEDWGTVDVQLSGEGIADAEFHVKRLVLQDGVPAAQAISRHGSLNMTRTVFRAPIFPAGVDVLTVELTETQGVAAEYLVTLMPSVGIKLGERTARIGGRVVLVLPHDGVSRQALLDWGFCDEATSLPGWAKPRGICDEAFQNIRAGMNGVPIVYRFAVTPGSQATVVLGLCESHWAAAGKRPVRCRVEGADAQTADPVARWGQHEPGLLTFAARDANGDGRLEISVRSAPHAADRNPILNAIWIYGADHTLALDQVLAGAENDAAQYYVDVGGKNDQSIYLPGRLEFRMRLAANETQQLMFLVASPGSSAPTPALTDWSSTTLRRAARDVWRDWVRREEKEK